MSASAEFAVKQARVVDWLQSTGADAALLASPANVAWLACGGELARSDTGLGFVVTAERCVLLIASDDADRVRQEEVRGLGIEIVPLVHLGAEALAQRAGELVPKARWRCDVAGLGFEPGPGSDDLRRPLGSWEIDRLRRLAHDAATALEEVAAECFRGILERDAAARLAAECMRRQITPRTILAGADERLETYPRPLPKGGSAERILMLALVGTRGGLHVALSRTICLSRPAATVVERFGRMAELAARLRHEARAGVILGEAVRQALPQPSIHIGPLGGVVGYMLPEVEAQAESTWRLAASQPLVWSLAAPGVRCEDTDLLGADSSELLTCTEEWPRRTYTFEDRSYEIPDMLQL